MNTGSSRTGPRAANSAPAATDPPATGSHQVRGQRSVAATTAYRDPSRFDVYHVHTPWSAGVQWKPNGVLGISVAYMTPELLGLRQGFWFGIGLNFKV